MQLELVRKLIGMHVERILGEVFPDETGAARLQQVGLFTLIFMLQGKGETRHQVTMSRKTCERLTGGKHTPERLIEAAFFFLLDREPKESILGRFDVTLIARYFPEFERELPTYLSPS